MFKVFQEEMIAMVTTSSFGPVASTVLDVVVSVEDVVSEEAVSEEVGLVLQPTSASGSTKAIARRKHTFLFMFYTPFLFYLSHSFGDECNKLDA